MPKPFVTEKERIVRNVNKRQRLKKSWDKHCKYGAEGETSSDMFTGNFSAVELDFHSSKDNFIRLLDEGVVVDGRDGFAYAVIAKGAIKEWFDNLPDDFEGHIDYDHIQAMKLGTFHKSDLRLVELDGDRYGVDVNVKLDNNLYLVKDILHNNTAHAVSSEFYSNTSKFVSSEEVTGEKDDTYPVPILTKLDIFGYAIVDNPKNANSYDEKILEKASNSERTVMNPDEVKAEAHEEEVVEATEEVVETPAEEVEAPVEEAETAETEVEASAEEGSTEEAETPAEEAETEAPAEEAPAAEEAEDASEKVEASIEKIGEKIEALEAELKAKDAKIAELEAKLSAKSQKEHTLAAKLEGFLNFAEADEPTEAEGKATTTEDKEGKDDYSAALENAFKEM